MRDALTLLALAFYLAECGASDLKPVKTVDLRSFTAKPGECQSKWIVFPSRLLWMDDAHLVAQLDGHCASQDVHQRRNFNQIILIDSKGNSRAILQANAQMIAREPGSRVLAQRDRTVELMDSNLQIVQSIQCPPNEWCDAFPAPAESTESDFAVCSLTGQLRSCDYYKGSPAILIAHKTVEPSGKPLTDPYSVISTTLGPLTSKYSRAAWKVAGDEIWYFDNEGTLTKSNTGHSTASVTAEPWTPKNGHCTGELSQIGPPRFLATCVGAHFYTDGELDFIFGYSRIALFDVTSKQILARIDGRAYTRAALSPNGKQIAITYKGSIPKVKLYKLD